MRYAILFALAACAVGCNETPAKPLTAERIIDRHLEAMGGLDRLRSFETAVTRGTQRLGDRTAALVMYRKHPSSMRMELTLDGARYVSMYDGREAWMFQDDHAPVRMPPEQAASYARMSRFYDAAMEWKERGIQLELVGEATVDDRAAYHLRFSLPDGSVQDRYLDKETYLELRRVVRAGSEAPPQDLRFSDYRPLPNGIVVGHLMQWDQDGTPVRFDIEQVEMGELIDDEMFRPAARR